MGQKILFIIFPGLSETIKHFKLNDVNGKFSNNSNFLSSLKKFGDIYFVKQNWNNINYYNKYEQDEKYLYNSNINFSLNDLNMNNICSKLYNDVKNFNGKFVLIGHSIGSIPLYYFSQKYSAKCLYNFIIDGTNYGSFYSNEKIHNILIKKCNNLSNNKIQELITKVKNYDNKALNELNLIIAGCMEKQIPINAKIIKVNTVSFRNLQINEDPSGNKDSKKEINKYIEMEDYYYKNNPKKYKTIYMINKTHNPFWNKEGRELILETIKCYLNLN